MKDSTDLTLTLAHAREPLWDRRYNKVIRGIPFSSLALKIAPAYNAANGPMRFRPGF